MKDGDRPFEVPSELERLQAEVRALRAVVQASGSPTSYMAPQEGLKLPDLMEVANIGHWIWDPMQSRLQTSGAFLRQLGLAQGATPDLRELRALIPPDEVAEIGGEVDAALQTGRPFSFEHRVMLPGGQARWLLCRGVPIFDEAGQLLSVTGLNVDVTDTHEAIDRLNDEEDRHRRLVDLSPVGIIIHRDGLVLFANAAAETMVAAEPGGLVGMPLQQLVDPQEWEAIRERIRNVVEREEVAPLREEILLRVDGTPIHVLATGTSCRYQGEPAVQVIILDRTRQRALEEQLRHSQRLESLGRLAGGIAHDFNNLLTAIMASADVALQTSLDAGIRRHLRTIIGASERAATITGKLLAVARRRVISPEIIDPSELVHGVEPLLAPLLGASVHLEVQLDADAGPIFVDSTELEQVILNLAVNARDAMPDGGHLTLRVKNRAWEGGPTGRDPQLPAGNYVEISVSDNGTGMDNETAALALEPFFTTKPQGKGSGLGLSMCLGIVEQSGGCLWLESTPGQGTTVVVLLPRTSVGLGRLPAPSRAVGKVVAYLEDDAMLVEVTRDALALDGIQLVGLGSSDGNALASQVHALIYDPGWRGGKGAELALQLRRLRPEMPTLIISNGEVDEHTVQGNEWVLHKPFGVNELREAVRRLIGGG